MDICKASIDELDPDLICPECKCGIEIYPDEYETVRGYSRLSMPVDIRCPNCDHKFRATSSVEIRWYRVAT